MSMVRSLSSLRFVNPEDTPTFVQFGFEILDSEGNRLGIGGNDRDRVESEVEAGDELVQASPRAVRRRFDTESTSTASNNTMPVMMNLNPDDSPSKSIPFWMAVITSAP